MKKLLFTALAIALAIVCVSCVAGKTVVAPGESGDSLTINVEETGRPSGNREIAPPGPSEGALLPEPPAGEKLEISCGQALRALLREFSREFGEEPARAFHSISTLEAQGDCDESQVFWLRQNANRYGWVLLAGGTLRYVGIPHAFLMRVKNLSLVQYLDYLRETGGVTVRINDQEYAVGYYPPGGQIFAPDGGCSISGDGQGGCVLTVLCSTQSR